MKNLLAKECRLAASPLAWLFIAFALMTMIPGYPILVGAFFVCFGLFQCYQQGRENQDILYTVLLPIRKRDAVTAKYLFACFIQSLAFVLMALLTALRMTVLKDAAVYVQNPMMNANPLFLAGVLLIFAAFNGVFIRGFFNTGWKFAKPFILFGVFSFIVVIVFETLHHFPGLAFLNDTDGSTAVHWIVLALAAVTDIGVTLLSCRAAQRKFEQVDL